MIRQNEIILFQGDSITDCERSYEVSEDLGKGYAFITAALLGFKHPEKKLTFYNRGISGNRTSDLQFRWQKDCLDLLPTLVSIYIGINDTARRYNDISDPISVEAYEANYRDILDRTREKLEAKLVLIEPFLLPVEGNLRRWREDLDPKINVVRQLAREYDARYVPLDGLFAQASTLAPSTYWTKDGVHPTASGHALIADAWLRAVDRENI